MISGVRDYRDFKLCKFEDHWSKPKSSTQWTRLFNFCLLTFFSWATFCQFPYISLTLVHSSWILLCMLLWFQGFIRAVASAWADFLPSRIDEPNSSFKVGSYFLFWEACPDFSMQTILCISALSLTSLCCNYLYNCIFLPLYYELSHSSDIS